MFLASPITFPNLGIEIDPSPVAFTVFGKDIYWYGIIIAAGFLLAVFYMLARAKDFGITQDDVLDMILWTVPIGVICARLYYCIFYWELYADDPISILYIWEGGLAIYGGIIGGVSAGFSVQASHRIGGGVVGTAQRRFLLALFQQLAKTVKIDPRNIRGQPVGQPGTRWL